MPFYLKFRLTSIFTLIACSILFSGCSVYQSDGRKYLEKQAFERAASASLLNAWQGCNRDQSDQSAVTEVHSQNENSQIEEGWTTLGEGPTYVATVSESDDFRLRIRTYSDFHCDFQFESAQALIESTPSAVELTQSLASIAFRPPLHVK